MKDPTRASSPTMITRLGILTPSAHTADHDQPWQLPLASPNRLDTDTETETYCPQAGLGTPLPIR